MSGVVVDRINSQFHCFSLSWVIATSHFIFSPSIFDHRTFQVEHSITDMTDDRYEDTWARSFSVILQCYFLPGCICLTWVLCLYRGLFGAFYSLKNCLARIMSFTHTMQLGIIQLNHFSLWSLQHQHVCSSVDYSPALLKLL